MSSWVYVGSKAYPPSNEFVRKLPISYCNQSCYSATLPTANNVTTASYYSTLSYATTESMNVTTAMADEYPPIADLYAISYLYLSWIGMLGTVVPGIILSLLTCKLSHFSVKMS